MRLILVILASLMLAAPVYANGGGEGNNTGCNGVGNPNSPCEQDDGNGGGGDPTGGTNTNTNTNSNTNTNTNEQWQGQAQGQIQGQIATGGNATVGDVSGGSINIYGGEEGESAPFSNNNEIDNSSSATGGAGGDATATGGSVNVGDTTLNNGGNTLIVGGSSGEGEGEGSGTLNSNAENNVNVDNTATGGNASIEEGAVNASNNATGNDVTVNIGEDGPLTASTQSVDANASVAEGAVQIDNSNNSTYKEAARTAATSFASVCTSGAASQGATYGVSVAVTSTQCAYLMQADAYMAMGNIEKATKFVDKAARSASIKGFMSNIRSVITLGIL